MSIKIHIHVTHRQHTNGQKTIEVEGTSVGEALNNFVGLYPGIKKELFDKKGNIELLLSKNINVKLKKLIYF